MGGLFLGVGCMARHVLLNIASGHDRVLPIALRRWQSGTVFAVFSRLAIRVDIALLR